MVGSSVWLTKDSFVDPSSLEETTAEKIARVISRRRRFEKFDLDNHERVNRNNNYKYIFIGNPVDFNKFFVEIVLWQHRKFWGRLTAYVDPLDLHFILSQNDKDHVFKAISMLIKFLKDYLRGILRNNRRNYKGDSNVHILTDIEDHIPNGIIKHIKSRC